MKPEIQELLDKLYCGIILNFNYDLLNHQMRFNVRVRNNDTITLYRVAIDEISSIIFHDGPAEERARQGEISEDKIGYVLAIMEVTGLDYYPISRFQYQVSFSSKDGSEVMRKCACNLCLEIWDTEIDILARRLKLNDQEFTLL